MIKEERTMADFTLSSGARMRPNSTIRRQSTILSALSLLWMGAPSVVSASAPTTADTDARLLAEHIAGGEAATPAAAPGSLDEPQARVLTAFRGHQSSLRAYKLDGDPSRLCSARDLLQSVLDEEDIDARVRTDTEELLAEIDALLSERHASTVCAPTVALLSEGASSASALVVVPRPTQEVSHHVDDDPRDSARAVTQSPPSTEGLLRDDPRPPVPAPVRRLRIVGGLSLGLGASLLGVATYGLVVDARAATQIREYGRLKEAGELTASEWAQSQKIGETGLTGSRLAMFAGIGGGVSLVTGAALLLFARKHARDDKPTLSLLPTAKAGQALLTLRGRF